MGENDDENTKTSPEKEEIEEERDIEEEGSEGKEENEISGENEIATPEDEVDESEEGDEVKEKSTNDIESERKAQQEIRAINEASAGVDSMYVPSPSLLSSPSVEPLLKQIDGQSLKDYVASPNVYMAHTLPVAAGAKVDVPIHVSSGGSLVEYSIESVAYDIGIEIKAEREEKNTVVRALDVVDAHVKPLTGKFLVGTVPCVLVFTFDNTSSWITGKKITYKVTVTPPSKENIMIGRMRRAKAALNAVEDDKKSASNRLSNAIKEKQTLMSTIARLEKELNQKKKSLDAVEKEEDFLNSRIELRTTQSKMLNDRINNGWDDEN